MVLESDKFAEFMLQFIEDKKIEVEDVLKIEEGEEQGNIAVYVPDDFIELFNKVYPEYNFEETINSYITKIVEEFVESEESEESEKFSKPVDCGTKEP